MVLQAEHSFVCADLFTLTKFGKRVISMVQFFNPLPTEIVRRATVVMIPVFT